MLHGSVKFNGREVSRNAEIAATFELNGEVTNQVCVCSKNTT
jgi:hypothetical protein